MMDYEHSSPSHNEFIVIKISKAHVFEAGNTVSYTFSLQITFECRLII